MKKLFLLLISGSIAFAGDAQYLHKTISCVNVNTNETRQLKDAEQTRRAIDQRLGQGDVARKATSATERWYNYVSVVDTYQAASGGALKGLILPLWNDTSSQINYTSGLAHNVWTSIGSILQPQMGFNDSEIVGITGAPSPFVGQMKITNSDSYTIDSIAIFGVYGFNPTKTSVVDTLRLSFVQGNNTASSDIRSGVSLLSTSHYGALAIPVFAYDSVRNMTAPYSTSTHTVNKQDILLTSANWGDTTSNGIFAGVYKLTTPVNAVATDMVGVSISFISGDPTYTANATVVDFVADTYPFNDFVPLIEFCATGTSSSATTSWAPYHTGDFNSGMYKKLPNIDNGHNFYVPHWAWSTSTGASNLQYPEIAWHATCSSCGVVTWSLPVDHTLVKNTVDQPTINAYPNPATNRLSVTFKLGSVSNVSVFLTNMVGQTVATQSINNVSEGKAVFNTSELANGVYMYSVNTNGTRSTGHVVIAH